MASTAATPNTRRVNPQQLAWGVMLLSFALFCVIVILIVLSIQFFLFHSIVPLQSTLDVARGTATLIGSDAIEQAVHSERDISDGGVVTTDQQSQASISFIDYQDNDRLVAMITVKNGSGLDVKQDSRPRFDLSSDAYWVDIDGAYGAFDIFVPENLGRPILISLETTLGPSTWLTASGRYMIVAAGAQVQVVNYSGEAVLKSVSGSQNIPAGQTASIQTGAAQSILVPAPINLLGDKAFTSDNVLDMNTPSDIQVWRCFSTEQEAAETLGTFDVSSVDGRPALRLLRDNGAASHGDTTCLQGLGTTTGGFDVSKFASVSVRATFKIQSQSLSRCGTLASECPFTLAMDYLPVNGGQPTTWYHGFFAFDDPNRAFPLICNSCIEQHEQINPGVWYTYESPNLKQTFAPDTVPQSIINLRFYSSGHQYEVFVRSVELLVDQAVDNGS